MGQQNRPGLNILRKNARRREAGVLTPTNGPAESTRAKHAAEKRPSEGGGGFNPRIRPAEFSPALAADGLSLRFQRKSRVFPQPRISTRRPSVIVRAAQIIPALRAHQLAMMPGEPVRTVRANLRVVIDLGGVN